MPVTFQGDECAFLGTGDGPQERNRYPLQWQDCDLGMVDHCRRLAALRTALAALRSPVIRQHLATGSLLSFFRGEPGPGEVLAVFNAGQRAHSLTLPAGAGRDAASGEPVDGSVRIGAAGWLLLRRE